MMFVSSNLRVEIIEFHTVIMIETSTIDPMRSNYGEFHNIGRIEYVRVS